jgi:hypothetical protein
MVSEATATAKPMPRRVRMAGFIGVNRWRRDIMQRIPKMAQSHWLVQTGPMMSWSLCLSGPSSPGMLQ